MDLPIWFMPHVNTQRSDKPCEDDAPFCGEADVIQPGDVLHTDVGICYLRLCTDTQEMGYVPRLDEPGVPAGLEKALTVGNRWQDLLTGEFVTGRTGNEILAAAQEAAKAEGIHHSIYTHPLGVFGHAPGPTIGMWDNQGKTPVRGDWPLYAHTAMPSKATSKSRCPNGTATWCRSSWSKARSSTAKRSTTLPDAKPNGTWCAEEPIMKHVVFLCTENSNRSQMAEAFARMHGAGVLEPTSAGSSPSGKVNPRAIRAMAEKGYDLAAHTSKSVEDLRGRHFDAVITMGCGDQCPWLPGDLREDWGLPDPREMEPVEFNQVRDEIEQRVQHLVARLRA